MNNKGFTLVELIVSIAILGLISAMSVPTLNAVQSQMEKKQFVSYGDALVSSAKIYTDSNYEDMFASGDTAQITYKDMNDKGLVKDIGIDNTTCYTDDTYVTVVKKGSSYVYCLTMNCINNSSNTTVYSNDNSEFGSTTGVCKGIKSYKVNYKCNKNSDDINKTVTVLDGKDYYADFSVCTASTGYKLSSYSYDSNTLTSGAKINVNKNITLVANYEAEKYTLIYESNCGTCNPTSKTGDYGSTWETLCTPSKTGYTFNYWVKKGTTSKITKDTKVTGNVTVTGKCTPNNYTLTYNTAHGSCTKSTKTGTYDSVWGELCTPTASGYKFGGWFVTGTNTEVTKDTKVTGNVSVTAKWTEAGPPVVKVNVYKRDSNGKKTGNVISTFDSNGNNSLTINSADVKTNYNGWYNNTSYPYGIYYEFIISDDSGIAKVQEKWNNSNQTSYTNPVNEGTVIKNPGSTTNIYLSAQGKRYATYTITNNKNKTTTVYIYADIDRTAPSDPTVHLKKKNSSASVYSGNNLANYSEGSWLNAWVVAYASGSEDSVSGEVYYQYTTTGNTTNETGTTGNYRSINAEGISYIKFKACDKAGNCTSYTSNKTIKLDRTAPSLSGTALNSNSSFSKSGCGASSTCKLYYGSSGGKHTGVNLKANNNNGASNHSGIDTWGAQAAYQRGSSGCSWGEGIQYVWSGGAVCSSAGSGNIKRCYKVKDKAGNESNRVCTCFNSNSHKVSITTNPNSCW